MLSSRLRSPNWSLVRFLAQALAAGHERQIPTNLITSKITSREDSRLFEWSNADALNGASPTGLHTPTPRPALNEINLRFDLVLACAFTGIGTGSRCFIPPASDAARCPNVPVGLLTIMAITPCPTGTWSSLESVSICSWPERASCYFVLFRPDFLAQSAFPLTRTSCALSGFHLFFVSRCCRTTPFG